MCVCCLLHMGNGKRYNKDILRICNDEINGINHIKIGLEIKTKSFGLRSLFSPSDCVFILLPTPLSFRWNYFISCKHSSFTIYFVYLLKFPFIIKTIAKTKGAIQNGQSRYTDNIGHKTQNENKQNKAQHRKQTKMSNTDPISKPGVNPGGRATLTPSQNRE